MACISRFDTAILRGETELALGTIRVNKKEESLKISDTWLPALIKTVTKQTIKDIKPATDPIASHA